MAPRQVPASSEHRLYSRIAGWMAVSYLLAGFVLPVLGENGVVAGGALFGFAQMHTEAALLAIVISAVALLRSSSLSQMLMSLSLASARLRAGLAALATALFFALRTRFINPDGEAFTYKFMRDIPWRGAHVTHDEMWELYLHSRFWAWSNSLFGWSVEFSYQVVSCLAGGLFVYLLLTFCWELFQARAVPGFLLIVSAGYMQLFFGDIENYTLTATLVMGYLLGSLLFLKGRTSVLVPSALMGICLTFHLLTGFLLPSMLYLWVLAWRRGTAAEVLLSAGAFSLVIAMTLLFFDLQGGLPLRDLWYRSHASGQGGNYLHYLVDPSWSYYLQLANLAFLLVPGWILVVPLAIHRRFTADTLNVFLLIAAGFMTAYVLLWKAQLGVYQDWNLYAIAAIPISLLIWRNVLRVETLVSDSRPVFALGILNLFHSASWIIDNHLVEVL